MAVVEVLDKRLKEGFIYPRCKPEVRSRISSVLAEPKSIVRTIYSSEVKEGQPRIVKVMDQPILWIEDASRSILKIRIPLESEVTQRIREFNSSISFFDSIPYTGRWRRKEMTYLTFLKRVSLLIRFLRSSVRISVREGYGFTITFPETKETIQVGPGEEFSFIPGRRPHHDFRYRENISLGTQTSRVTPESLMEGELGRSLGLPPGLVGERVQENINNINNAINTSPRGITGRHPTGPTNATWEEYPHLFRALDNLLTTTGTRNLGTTRTIRPTDFFLRDPGLGTATATSNTVRATDVSSIPYAFYNGLRELQMSQVNSWAVNYSVTPPVEPEPVVESEQRNVVQFLRRNGLEDTRANRPEQRRTNSRPYFRTSRDSRRNRF